MNVSFALATRSEVIEAIESSSTHHPVRIATINPEFMLEAQHNALFSTALANMTHVVVDGNGLLMALTLFTKVRPEHIPGATLVHELFVQYQEGEKSFYLLGDDPGVAENAAKQIQKLFPQIRIVGAEEGKRFAKNQVTLEDDLATRIVKAKPDILLVGFGAPKQELWIQEATNLPVPVMIGIGGTMGFYTRKKRAPKVIRSLKLEWAYRGLTEKGHWRRALRAFLFAPRAFFWWITHPKHSASQD